jgi:uracil phosphoribosyltransferase
MAQFVRVSFQNEHGEPDTAEVEIESESKNWLVGREVSATADGGGSHRGAKNKAAKARSPLAGGTVGSHRRRFIDKRTLTERLELFYAPSSLDLREVARGLGHGQTVEPDVVLVVVDDPALAEILGVMRDRSAPNDVFKAQCHRAGQILVRHAIEGLHCPSSEVLLVPVLRAGLGFHPAALELLPEASTWGAGLYRDEKTLEAHWYGDQRPTGLQGQTVVVLDPMLATGGTAEAVVSALRLAGAGRVVLVCLLCVNEGLQRLTNVGPCDVFAAAKDPQLNDHGYIVPGLGDAGDRLFGLKVPGQQVAA